MAVLRIDYHTYYVWIVLEVRAAIAMLHWDVTIRVFCGDSSAAN